MCEANAYLIDQDGHEKLYLKAVDQVFPTEEEILLINIFNERKIFKGKIKQLALVDHKIILEKN